MNRIQYLKWFRGITLLSGVLLVFALSTGMSSANTQDPLKPKPIKSLKQLNKILVSKSIHKKGILVSGMTGGSVLFSAAASVGDVDHSDTNVQVQGVDEGDIVKNDGRYIYRLHLGKVQIISAYPADQMAVVSELTYGSEFNPIELYRKGNQLIVVGNGWHDDTGSTSLPVMKKNNLAIMPVWTPTGESRTMVRVYDITDRTQPVMQREVAFSGDYLTSRKVENSFYLIGRKYPNIYLNYLAETKLHSAGSKTRPKFDLTRENTLPRFSDSSRYNGNERFLPVDNISYFPGFIEPDYVIVAAFRLDLPDQDADIKAYLGGGDITYASRDNLYLSAADYGAIATGENPENTPKTHLYKFALNDGTVNFTTAGEVPGTALNSFSMDEHNGFFRIATTTEQWEQTGDTGALHTWNNVYTLDGNMSIAGKLEHLAEGERIFSARFIGDRGYLVTFQQIDPLFVIDLAEPAALKVLGELKIPGFSNYLHPFDENHLLGFGQDTGETDTGVVTSGMKVALFDVTDVAHPTQMHSITIGEQGTYSELLYNHKALLFNKTTGLLGFPISVTAKVAGEEWPSEVFQGAHVYKVSLAQGFQKQAEITHHDDGSLYDWNRYIQRLLTIGNQLYTLSDGRIQANGLDGFNVSAKLDFTIDTPIGCDLAVADDSVVSEIALDCPILIDPIVELTAKKK